MQLKLPLLFPPRCVLCGTLLTGEALLCESCATAVRQEYRITEGVRVPETDGAAAALVYKGLVRAAVHRYKFRHAKELARWFAAHTAAVLAAQLGTWRPDAITYVPLGIARWRERGFNQSLLIARLVAKQLDVPCVSMLRKRPFVRRQSAQSKRARKDNVRSAFCAKPQVQIAGKRIVLLDDVLTTGATMSSCAQTLRQAGAERVFALAVTKSPRQRT